jgi:hypothetical protein
MNLLKDIFTTKTPRTPRFTKKSFNWREDPPIKQFLSLVTLCVLGALVVFFSLFTAALLPPDGGEKLS